MTSEPTPGPVPELVIDDRVTSRLAGYATALVPGVARLQPTATRRVARGAVELARRGFGRDESGGVSVDTDAVEVEETGGAARVTVRIVATGTPPILDTVDEIQRAVGETLRLHADVTVEVCVVVVDCDPGDTKNL